MKNKVVFDDETTIFKLNWYDTVSDIKRNLGHCLSHIMTLLGKRGIQTLAEAFTELKENNYVIRITVQKYRIEDEEASVH